MSLKKHDLLHEFPELAEKIHHLKTTNAHFRKLFEDYHETDHEIYSIESGATAASDEHLDKKRTHRVYLKDELYKMLTAK